MLEVVRAMVDISGLEPGAHEAMIQVAGTPVAGINGPAQVAPLVIRVIVTIE